MRNFELAITGTTPILLHHDDVEWADQMEAWKLDPEATKGSKAGDDRSPAWRWIGNLYHDGEWIGVPRDNLMRCLMEAGAMVPVPGGKSGKTFKAQTQSGMTITDFLIPLVTRNGNQVPFSQVQELLDSKEPDFAAHRKVARELDFDLHVKRAKVGQSKHVRVRPIFAPGWKLTASLSVWDDQITPRVLQDIVNFAGRYKGLCDWRPSSKTPGSYGMFTAEVRAV